MITFESFGSNCFVSNPKAITLLFLTGIGGKEYPISIKVMQKSTTNYALMHTIVISASDAALIILLSIGNSSYQSQNTTVITEYIVSVAYKLVM